LRRIWTGGKRWSLKEMKIGMSEKEGNTVKKVMMSVSEKGKREEGKLEPLKAEEV
jgi:hypothetical protein